MITHSRIAGCLLLVCIAADCSGDTKAAEETASAAASVGSSSDLCSLFNTQEIRTLLGTPVAVSTVSPPSASACQWDGTTDDGAYAQVQVVGVRYWTPPKSAEGYEKLSGLGKEAFVAPEMGGWQAGALTDTAAALVAVKSGSATRETAVRFLRDMLGRM